MIRPGIRDVPNILSALRLLAAPFAAWLIVTGQDTAALAVFAIAGLSDGLDGFVARRWGVTSNFGAWLDPLADKLLMLFSLSALAIVHVTPLWLVGLVVARDGSGQERGQARHGPGLSHRQHLPAPRHRVGPRHLCRPHLHGQPALCGRRIPRHPPHLR